jgi:5-methylcytosine-specific restriction enzyme A
MPSRPMRQCAAPSCRNLSKNTYCDKCRAVRKQQKQITDKHYNDNVRNKERAAFYKSRQWTKLRQYILQRDHRLCQPCQRNSKITAGNIVDHIIPLEVDMALGLEPNNLQTICKPCHNKKTAEDKRKYSL